MIKALPMLVSYLITYFILAIFEKKFSIIEKLDSKIKFKAKNNYKESFYAISPVILNFILGVFGIYFVNFSNLFYMILCGFTMGIGLAFSIFTKKF
jgi:hypothetical protein